MEIENASPDLEKAIWDSHEAYAKGEPRFFDYLTDDVRVYNLYATEPMIGRELFQKEFTTFEEGREVRILKTDVKPEGDRAVLSQTIEVGKEDVAFVVTQTVVWENQDGRWLISHIHTAQVGQPIVGPEAAVKSTEDVRVLNERIATVAATLGVAQ